MKKTLSVFLLLSFTTGFSQTEINQFDTSGKRHGKWMKKYEGTNQIRYRGTFEHGRETGTFEFFKRVEKNHEAQGEIHPFATKTYTPGSDLVAVSYFTEKGNLLSTGQVKNRERTGKWTYYHPNTDVVMMVENYQNDQLHGEKITYYANGNVAKKAHYQNGNLDGIFQLYSKNGTLLKYFTYQNGQLHGLVKYFDAEGNLTATGMYQHGRKNGEWKTYENGKLVKTETFPKH